ncbi:peptidylprolyl isomerase [Clostridium merdae]|uniref:peptidylprolyl isomerase n=1 Tax=Clostridium merdae TaxID=1958780 RepID=UPI000A268F5A|nr:peptidylprolyl isomerase [Clostridium merdae]
MQKRLRIALVGLSTLLLLTACASQPKNEVNNKQQISSAAEQQNSSAAEQLNSSSANQQEKTLGYQLDKPTAGEEIAVMKTSMGDIKLRFFPEAAPKTVDNFKQLSKKGYYNGITFHRVVNNFVIQGGDPTATGLGGESAFGKAFEDEFSKSLLNLRGAVAMANSGPNTNGSQFFINQAPISAFYGWEYYEQGYELYKQNPEAVTARHGTLVDMSKISDAYKKLYTENGGNPTLDGAYNTTGRGHTVFAQVFEGLDVVDKIAAVEVGEGNKPLKDVTITNITLEKYKG